MTLRLLGVLLIAVFAGAPTMAAQTARPQISVARDPTDPLKGLRGFQVEILINSTLADSSAIRTRTELKLRQNGIRVGDDQRSYLMVECVAIDDNPETAVIAYGCNISVAQWVTRTYPTPMRVLARIWDEPGAVGTVGRRLFVDNLTTEIDQLCDAFLNAWYKANPK